MDYNEHYNFIQTFLQPDEILLWQGTPSPGKMKTYGKIPMLVALIWLGISLILEIACLMSGQIAMILFGLPF